MTWLKRYWHWVALNVWAMVVCVHMAWQAGADDFYTGPFSMHLYSGIWAMRFLLISLAITPIVRITGWSGASVLRKPAGLWAFGFAFLHSMLQLRMRGYRFSHVVGILLDWNLLPGAIAFACLLLLAATSVQPAIQLLGKAWKPLHRIVYIAGLSGALHGLLMTSASKRIMGSHPNALYENATYACILLVLLLLRIPAIRDRLTFRQHRTSLQAKADAATTP